LPWFPADTETLIVARDVDISADAIGQKPQTELSAEQQQQSLQRGAVWGVESLALGKLRTRGDDRSFFKSGEYAKAFGKAAARLVIQGGRQYETVSAFGSYRWHGETVAIFDDDAREDVARFIEAVRRDATETRTIRGHEVICLPTDDKMESTYKLKPWQGIFITLLKPNAVLCASSDIYLDEMFARMESTPADRALPADLPEWKFVDSAARVCDTSRPPRIRRLPASCGSCIRAARPY
jgi:hypothetical protein